jgi:hypothetical protein
MTDDHSGDSGQDTSQSQDAGASGQEPDHAPDPNEPMFPLPDMDYELKEADYSGSHERDDDD